MIGAGLTPKTTLLIMLVAPALEAVAFWGILRHNNHIHVDEQEVAASRRNSPKAGPGGELTEKERLDLETTEGKAEELEPLTGFKSKMRYIPKLLIYMVPLTLVYLLEYFINQGLVIIRLTGFSPRKTTDSHYLFTV